MGISTQVLPMLPKDLKVIIDYHRDEAALLQGFLDDSICFVDMVRISPLRGLFSMHSHQCFIEVMMNLSTSSPRTSLPYIGFRLIFRKTNKDPNKREGLSSMDATNH